MSSGFAFEYIKNVNMSNFALVVNNYHVDYLNSILSIL